jgi:CBS domain-containing protein
MTTQVVTVMLDTNVREVARILLINRISAVPVVDKQGHILGMLSEGDLMRRVEAGTDGSGSWWLSLLSGPDYRAEAFVKSHGLHAKDVMTREVISVSEDAPLDEVATLLERHRIKRVPVVRDGKLVGIVSRANLLHGLVAQRAGFAPSGCDDEIRAAIMDALVKIGIPRHFLNVVVSDGVVYLWGATHSESERDAVRVAAETTPGAKRIENHLFVLSAKLHAALGSE